MSDIYQVLKNEESQIAENFPLRNLTTFKIGGPAEFFLDVKSTDTLLRVHKLTRKSGIPLTVIGGGSNLLVADDGVSGLVVRNTMSGIQLIGIKGERSAPDKFDEYVFLKVAAGVPMAQLVNYCTDNGFYGLEMHKGLPGTLGGAVYMNSKWTNPPGYVGDTVQSADLLSSDGTIRTVPQSYFRFAYDYSMIQETGELVLSCVIRLKKGDRKILAGIANDSLEYRRKSQPQGVFSAGCIFRNITKAEALIARTPNAVTSAGFFIDHSGLKGFSVGDAIISDQHANFIINKGHATARDVLQLIDLIREKVKKQFGVSLKEEIVKIGNF